MLVANREALAVVSRPPYDARLAYIEMVNGPYLQLDIIGSQMTYVELYMTPYVVNTRRMLFGGSRANSGNSSSVYFDINGGVWRNTGITAVANQEAHIVVTRRTGTSRADIAINQARATNVSFGPFTMDRLYLQVGNSNTSVAAQRLNGRLGPFVIKTASRTWSFVPCLKDKAPKFYEEVSGSFCGNAGSGSFGAGPVVPWGGSRWLRPFSSYFAVRRLWKEAA